MTTRIANLGKQFLNMAQKIKTDITLYTTNTPNGIKPSILLEELNLEYKVKPNHSLYSNTAQRLTKLRCTPSR
jgi:hypothetical protein